MNNLDFSHFFVATGRPPRAARRNQRNRSKSATSTVSKAFVTSVKLLIKNPLQRYRFYTFPLQDNEGDIEEEHEEVGIKLTWQKSEGMSLFSVYSTVAEATDRDLRCHGFESFAESVFFLRLLFLTL